jgi:SAM-dependent methyltransferase
VTVAPDGSPVEVYRRLPDRGEGGLVARAVPPPAELRERRGGTGRVTRQLVAHGYDVVAVDESPEMLEHVRDVPTVRARIEDVDLGRRFDAALLLSNLLTVDPVQRRAFLDACARHAARVVVETLPLGWSPVTSESLRIDRIEDGVAHGEVFYEGGWSHAFAMHVFADERELRAALAAADWQLEAWLDRARGWFTAVRARP